MTNEGFFWGDDYLALPRDPHPWIVRDLLPVGGLVNIFGRPKTGKSFAALGLAHAISTGAPRWLGFDVEKAGAVAYLQIDTPRSLWSSRLNVIKAEGFNLSKIAFADTLTTPYPFNILIPEQQKWLKNFLQNVNPIATIIDTIRESHSGDENDSTIMKNVISALVEACRPSAICLLAHSRKENMMQGEDIMTDARGSSYIAGRMDTIVKLTGKSMIYKGRSCGENKIKVKQHPIHGLLLSESDDTALDDAISETISNNPGKTKNWTAIKVHELLNKSVSVKTITRRIDEILARGLRRTVEGGTGEETLNV